MFGNTQGSGTCSSSIAPPVKEEPGFQSTHEEDVFYSRSGGSSYFRGGGSGYFRGRGAARRNWRGGFIIHFEEDIEVDLYLEDLLGEN